MERFTIPFEYQSHNYYVFIEKHPESKNFGITQLMPETDELVDRQISVKTVQTYKEAPAAAVLTLQETIIGNLAAYLQLRGWPIE